MEGRGQSHPTDCVAITDSSSIAETMPLSTAQWSPVPGIESYQQVRLATPEVCLMALVELVIRRQRRRRRLVIDVLVFVSD